MKKIIHLILTLSAIVVLVAACSTEPSDANYQQDVANPDFLHRSMKNITDVIVHDIFSPPVASRIYAYSSLAAYEAMRPSDGDYRTMAGQLNGLTEFPKPDADKTYAYPVASVAAMLKVGQALVFSEDKIEKFRAEIFEEMLKTGVPKDVFENSKAFGEAVAAHVLDWATKDSYKQTRTFPKYNVDLDDESRWVPTPPDYMEGIEPSWNVIRTLVIDSAQQFRPPFPTRYDMTKGSDFYKETMEVYETGKGLSEEQTAIAKFWDCNPYVSVHKAHLMYATKKITPGGHWVGIASIAAKKTNADLMKSAETYLLTSVSLFDGFISCWDEKYRSNLVRPETVINKHIDEDWRPLLQTPPFPEYTSGHSVISSSAATALTSLYGDNFSFVDNTEEEYGLPPRSFNSFIQASEEAAVSRLYGGIHYRPAIDNGVAQGRALGKFIVEQIQTKK